MSWEKTLLSGASDFNINLSEKQISLFSVFLKELKEWNKKINLTSITNDSDIAIKHFLDSMIVSSLFQISGKVADIGSGSGFPGIPLKIKDPSLDMVLIEAKRKRANFLKYMISLLDLKSIEIFNERAETFEKKNCFDWVLSRAFADLKTCCKMSLPLIKKEGHILLMRGKNMEEEITQNSSYFLTHKIAIAEKRFFSLPFDMGNRGLMILKKTECFT